MLTKQDLIFNWKILEFLSNLNIIPIKFDGATGKLQIQDSVWRRLGFRCWQSTFFIYTCYLAFQTVRALLFSRPGLHQVTIMTIITVCFMIINYCMNHIFVVWSALNVKLHDHFSNYGDKSVQKKTDAGQGQNNFFEKMAPRRSCEELLITVYPFLVYSMAPTFALLYIADSSIPFLLMAAVPDQWRNFGTITICLLGDSLMMSILLPTVHFVGYFLMSFVNKLNHDLENQIKNLSSLGTLTMDNNGRVAQELEKFTKAARIMHLELVLVNLGWSRIIFLNKFWCLKDAILGGFGAIRLVSTEPVFALISSCLFINGVVMFIGSYDKAFAIPETISVLKKKVLMRSQQFPLKMDRDLYKITCASVPALGIRCGNFTTMERASTPIFVDYVANHIASLLIAF